MSTEWIGKAAIHYRDHLREQREQAHRESMLRNVEKMRLDRIALEGPGAGAMLWNDLKALLKSDTAEFNKEFGDAAMRVEDRADGTFKVILSDNGESNQVAVLKFDQPKATLNWKVFGGLEGTPLTIGLRPEPDSFQPPLHGFQFTTGNTYYTLEDLSSLVLRTLLP